MDVFNYNLKSRIVGAWPLHKMDRSRHGDWWPKTLTLLLFSSVMTHDEISKIIFSLSVKFRTFFTRLKVKRALGVILSWNINIIDIVQCPTRR